LDGEKFEREGSEAAISCGRPGRSREREASRAKWNRSGVLVSHKRGMKTRLADGDVVGFVKAAAGG
jgi:molybdopterin converting factor small subunit